VIRCSAVLMCPLKGSDLQLERFETIKLSLTQELCDKDLAVIVLQSMIRGCATNVRMAEGLTLNAGLMLELRTTHPLWEDSQVIMQMKEERQRRAEEHRRELLHNVRSDNY